MNKKNNDTKTTHSTYIIGKKTYKITFTANTPSEEALKNFVNEILKAD